MKITDSLEKVYTAMGGTDEFNKDDIAEGIGQISEVAGSGGSGGGSDSGIGLIVYDPEIYEENLFEVSKAILDSGKAPMILEVQHDGGTGEIIKACTYTLWKYDLMNMYFGNFEQAYQSSNKAMFTMFTLNPTGFNHKYKVTVSATVELDQ